MGKEEKKGIGNGKNDTIRIAIVGIGDVPFAIKSILQYYLRFNDFAPTHSLVVALFVFWVYFYFLFLLLFLIYRVCECALPYTFTSYNCVQYML